MNREEVARQFKSWNHAYRAFRRERKSHANARFLADKAELEGRIPVRLCSIKGCSNKHSARGMCVQHYGRWQYCGDAQPNVPLPVREEKR